MVIDTLSSCGFTVDDLRFFIESIDNECVPPLSQKVDIPSYVRKITDRGVVLACADGGQLLGFISFYCNDQETKCAHLSLMGVGREYRGRGIARALLQEAIGYVRKAGFQRIGSQTWHTNAASLKLHLELGFTVTDEIPDRGDARTVKLECVLY